MRTLAALGLIALLTVPLPVLAGQRRTRCADYATREQAQAALQRGETWLDRNNDGRACDNHNFTGTQTRPSPRPTTTPTPRATPSPRR